ncbi:hypothetical protein [Paraburkholderia caballeronis]|uniref:Uncharacterized protein n=1 Tax=Paraburkholderia caballeronis TaxID=416943 RepID=A0A1H7LU35_9BURK|nr:hypothetical protein [Paraburkholderia caballeronis]PXW28604.1 hypothetical protein C7403_102498 [Paraburkholderia caballeronis]PXX03970.1 hypothetical protein C7407_102498 [Paraburkholderia caballeronis]RAK04714.1 hypothetical protein C7409_102498 [Paraburkholderia caballeronis]SED68375.1 hypothetical protein SAMN05445871_3677 [Paraburkholderia caballeronis]SEL02461.1 hypothetical protein SAMN05192542_104499 [Paraburkholderia caballeronis]
MSQSLGAYLAAIAAMVFVAIWLAARQWRVRRLAKVVQPGAQRIPARTDSNL